MDEKALIQSLKNQVQNLRSLLMIVKSKQKALISRDRKGLELSVESEEKFISKINSEEQNRLKILSELCIEFSLAGSENELLKLDNFLEGIDDKVPSEFIEEIKENQGIIRKLTAQISSVNEQNKFLIETARNLVKELIASAIGKKKKSLIDRKI